MPKSRGFVSLRARKETIERAWHAGLGDLSHLIAGRCYIEILLAVCDRFGISAASNLRVAKGSS